MRYSEKGLSPDYVQENNVGTLEIENVVALMVLIRFVEEWDVREDSVLFVYSICTCCTLVFEHNFSFFFSK